MSRVLVGEDSASIRLLLRRRLEHAGHQVSEARNGAEVLEALASRRGTEIPDVVLLDAMMPAADGAGVLRRIKADRPGIPVIVVTALRQLDESDGWEAADAHVTKPIDFGELLDRVETLTGARPRP